MSKRVMIVDDDQSMCELIEADLSSRGITSEWRTSPEAALSVIRDGNFDVILTDLQMPGMNGLALCERIVANRPDIPVIVMTAFGSMETAIAAMRAGAYDFVSKPVELDILALRLERAIQHRSLSEQVRVLSDRVHRSNRFSKLLGESPAMQQLFDDLHRVASTDTSVLITGESGTGKELVARALHDQSHRHGKPFVAINCANCSDTRKERSRTPSRISGGCFYRRTAGLCFWMSWVNSRCLFSQNFCEPWKSERFGRWGARRKSRLMSA